ncbi:MAG TPA: M24 family metallopeptidase [Chloroflexota bacterium]|jgi:Xaa-Pro aminopeptidase|nr:M24 family metallopeptidase [Chloroflexota bacterium]
MYVDDIQAEMRRRGIDGWLVASFRGSNPIFHHLTGIAHPFTRRTALWLPAQGGAVLLGSSVDGHSLVSPNGWLERTVQYAGLAGLQAELATLLRGADSVAMEYTTDGANPTISRVDAGFVEWVRAQGTVVVSSGDLISLLVAWDADQVTDHRAAAAIVDRVRGEAFREIFARAESNDPATEHALTASILTRLAAAGLVDAGADVAVNAHASDPHYLPSADRPAPILPGDSVLIDLWARRPGDRSPYADSTWMGFVGRQPPAEFQRSFLAVREARDAGISLLAEACRDGQLLRGRDVDRYVRNLLAERGYPSEFTHRTGHSLGWRHIHGDGVNLDDFEFPDDRVLAPVAGITIEPGVYFPGRFGVRLEVSIVLTEQGPLVTTGRQDALEMP